jgi:hypothetical protein
MLNAILQHQFIYIMAISLQDRKGELPVKDTNLLQVTDKRHHKRHHKKLHSVYLTMHVGIELPNMEM